MPQPRDTIEQELNDRLHARGVELGEAKMENSRLEKELRKVKGEYSDLAQESRELEDCLEDARHNVAVAVSERTQELLRDLEDVKRGIFTIDEVCDKWE